MNTVDFENGLNNLKRDFDGGRNMISEKTSRFTTSSDERLMDTTEPDLITPEQKIDALF
jgi:hypothetical protein